MSSRSQDDNVFKALAHPRRREMLDRLKDEPKTTGMLCDAFPDIDRCTVMLHLKVLEESGLVTSEKTGRVRTCRVDPKMLSQAEQWVSERRQMWERSLDRLGQFLDEEKP